MSDTSESNENVNAREGGKAKDNNHHYLPPDNVNTSVATSETASTTTTETEIENKTCYNDWSNENKNKNLHKKGKINQSKSFHNYALSNKKQKEYEKVTNLIKTSEIIPSKKPLETYLSILFDNEE